MNIEKAEFLLEKLLDNKRNHYLEFSNNRVKITENPDRNGEVLSSIKNKNTFMDKFMKIACSLFF